MLRTRDVCFIAACALMIAGDEPAAKKKADPFEPRSAPGAGQAYLTRFAGDWEVTKTFHPRDGAPVVAQGRCRQTMVRDGRFLKSEFTFDAPGGKTTSGEGLIGFEPESGLFTGVWTDSRQTRMSIRRGREPFDSARIVLYSVSLDPNIPDPRTSRTVSVLKDDDRVLTHEQFGINSDGTERLVMELVMNRVLAKP